MCSPLIILTVFMVSLDIKTAKSEDPWSFDDSRFEDSSRQNEVRRNMFSSQEVRPSLKYKVTVCLTFAKQLHTDCIFKANLGNVLFVPLTDELV